MRLQSVDLSRQLVRVDGGSEVHPLAAVLPGPPTAQQWREACRELAGRLLRGEAEHVTAAELRSVCERLAVLQRCAAELPAPGQPLDAARRKALQAVLSAPVMDEPTWELWRRELGKWRWDAERAAQLAATGGPVKPWPEPVSAPVGVGGAVEPATEEVTAPQPPTPQQRQRSRLAANIAPAADQPQGTSAELAASTGMSACPQLPAARSSYRQAAGDGLAASPASASTLRAGVSDGAAIKRLRSCGLETEARGRCEGPDAKQQRTACVPSLRPDHLPEPGLRGQTDSSAQLPGRPRAKHPAVAGPGLRSGPDSASALPPGTSTAAAREVAGAATTASGLERAAERYPQHPSPSRPRSRSRSRSRSRPRSRSRDNCKRGSVARGRSRPRARPSHRSQSRSRSPSQHRSGSRSCSGSRHRSPNRFPSRGRRAGSRSPGRAHGDWRTEEDWARDLHRLLMRQPGCKMAWAEVMRAGFEIPNRFKAPERSLTGFLYSFRDLWTLSDPNRPKHLPLELTAVPPGKARLLCGAEVEAKWRTAEDWARDVHRFLLSQAGHKMAWSDIARAGFEVPLRLKPRHIALARFLYSFPDLWTLSEPNRPKDQPLELTALPPEERRGRSRDRSRAEPGPGEGRSASRSPPLAHEPRRVDVRGGSSERAERCGANGGDGGGVGSSGGDWPSVAAWAEAVYRHLLKQPDCSAKVAHLHGAGLGLPNKFLDGSSAAVFLKGMQFRTLWTAWKPDASAPLWLTAQPGALEPWLGEQQRDVDRRAQRCERERGREQERQRGQGGGEPGAREVDRERSREGGEKDRSGRRRGASVERGSGDASPRHERHASRPRSEAGPSPAPDSEEGFKRRVATFLSEQPGRSATLPSLCK